MMDYQILGKKINFIKLHDFLSRIETREISSHLHEAAEDILRKLEKQGEVEWEGKRFTRETFLEHLKEEDGEVILFKLQETPYGPEGILRFDNGNGLTISLKDERQFVQIYEFLIEYSEQREI